MGKQKTASSRKQKQKQKQEIIGKIKKQIKEQLIDVMSEDVCKEVQPNFEDLVKAANTLYENLQRIEDKEGKIARIEEQAKKKKTVLRTFFSNKENLSLLLKNKEEQRQQKVINDVLKYIHKFELALDQFLNRKVQLVWVDEQGNLLVATEDGYNELLSTATVDSSNIRGKMAENAMRNLEKYNNNNYINKEVLKEFNDSIDNRKGFYRLALERYEASTIEGGEKKPQKHFYWKRDTNKDPESENIIGNYILSKKINNKGRIAEAYVESVINDTEESPEEDNWLRHLNSLIYEDNVSAILRGDVIRKIINEKTGDSKLEQVGDTGDSKLEQHFAVKSGSWSTAGIRQYLILAERLKDFEDVQISPALFRIGLPMLLNAKSSKTIDNIKNNIVESAGKAVSNKAEEKISNTISDQLTNLLKMYFKNTSVEDIAKRTAILSANLNIKLEI